MDTENEGAGRGGDVVFVTTQRLEIAALGPGDAEALAAYFAANAAHLGPWEPIRPEGYHSVVAWRARGAEYEAAAQAGTGFHYAIRFAGRADIVGLCSFANVVRGAFQACHLSYSVDHRVEGTGVMTEALSAVIPAVLARQGLHRIMANYQPQNARSGRLLARLGFVEEGFAKDYLQINGVWRDHVLTALVARD